jgi:hypothetical protein
MDIKQKQIFNRICDKYELPHNNKFIQHRNLKEFRYFFIERINPNHRILLFGKFKKSMSKSNHFPNKIIKVGEIFLTSMFLLVPTNNIFLDLELKLLTLLVLTHLLFDLIINETVLGIDLNVNWYRGEYRVRKNLIRC